MRTQLLKHVEKWYSSRRRKHFSRAKAVCGRLRLESLEDRLVPAVFNVNSLADILNPPAGTVTLRSAIQAANASPGDDTINLTVADPYKIDLLGAHEDAHATGDFDVLARRGHPTLLTA